MNDAGNTAKEAIRADEDILTHTDSDEALEAAADTGRGVPSLWLTCSSYSPQLNCC